MAKNSLLVGSFSFSLRKPLPRSVAFQHSLVGQALACQSERSSDSSYSASLSMLALSHQGVDRREPAVSIHARAINHAEEFFLQPLGDGAPAAGADGDPVDRADRRNFRRRAAEENLVGDVQQFARNDALHYRDARFPGQREDGVARDAGKDASAQRRRVDLTVPHYKDVLAGA